MTEPKPEDTAPDQPDPPQRPTSPAAQAAPQAPAALVHKLGGWHRVQYGNWQVSVAEDGLIMLPRHLHPRDWVEFAGAMAVAVDIAGQVIGKNETRAKATATTRSNRRPIVTEGPPPDGTTRMPVRQRASAQQRAATIGRQKRRGTPAASPVDQQPLGDRRVGRATAARQRRATPPRGGGGAA